MMSFQLLKIYILYIIVLNISVTLAWRRNKPHDEVNLAKKAYDSEVQSSLDFFLGDRFTETPTDWSLNTPTDEEATADLQNIMTDSTDDPILQAESNVKKNTTRSKDVSATSGEKNICPKGQSTFSKKDLITLIDHVAEKELNITFGINESYHNTATRARDIIIQEFNDFNTQFEERPDHLIHVLNDLESIRQENVLPLVKIASATLQEYTSVHETFIMLYNKTVKSLEELERYKQICNWNCNMQYSFVTLKMNTVLLKDDKDTLCSTLENVYMEIKERLQLFERKEIERLDKENLDTEEVLNNGIQTFKASLRETAVRQFGITMYELLSLYDDQYHFIKVLEEFNSHSYINLIKRVNMNIEYRLLDFDAKLQQFRLQCLSCNKKSLRRISRNTANEMNIAKLATAKEFLNHRKNNVLDQLLNDKINSVRQNVTENLESIYEELHRIVNDEDLVEKTVAKLIPLQESMNQNILEEKQQLQSLMLQVPKESRENVKKLLLKSRQLVGKIEDALKSL